VACHFKVEFKFESVNMLRHAMQDMLYTSRKPLEVINQKIEQNACAYLIDFDTEMSAFRADELFKASLPLKRTRDLSTHTSLGGQYTAAQRYCTIFISC